MKTKGYYEREIKPSSGGFGEYDCGEISGDGYEDLADLLDAMRKSVEVVVLGEDTPSDGPEDIRGLIHNEPEIVVAYRDPDPHFGGWRYAGITREAR